MAYTSPFDPKSSEARSSWLAGLTEAMSIVTRQLNLKASDEPEEITLEELFIDESDRRRIYQAKEWNKLWLTDPEPIVKLDGEVINEVTDGFTIDYLGGSIAFEDASRPQSDVLITVTVKHLLGGEGTDRSEVIESIKKQMEMLSADVADKAVKTEVEDKLKEITESIDAKTAILSQGLEQVNQSIETVTSELSNKQDKLTFDKIPTDESVNPVESKGIKTYVDETINTEVQALEEALDTKQNTLEFDEEPIENSNNPVKSGGVYSALEKFLPVQDPGFLGVLWSQGENGDTIEAMTEYDSGDGNKTSYMSIHREGAAADIGVSKSMTWSSYSNELVDLSYLVLTSTNNGGNVETQASKYGASISMQSPGATTNFSPNQFTIETVQGNPSYHENPAASMYFANTRDGRFLGGKIYFFANENGQVRINAVATPEKPKDAANKEYVDQSIQQAISDSWAASY